MKLKAILKEVLSEEYPTTWNWDEFKAISSFSGRKKYCDDHLDFLVSGSGRLVYKVDEEKVLKLAKNKKGVAQCEVEISLGDDSYLTGIVAPIYESDENSLWVEMALARKLTKSNFKTIVGYSFDDFCTKIKHFYSTSIKPSRYSSTPDLEDEEMRDLIENDEFYTGVCDLMGSFDMPVGDLTRMSTYGVIKSDSQDSVVLIDYGLTNDVYDSYYK